MKRNYTVVLCITRCKIRNSVILHVFDLITPSLQHVTQDLATSTSVATARLPIVEHMVKLDANSPSQILAVNQGLTIWL